MVAYQIFVGSKIINTVNALSSRYGYFFSLRFTNTDTKNLYLCLNFVLWLQDYNKFSFAWRFIMSGYELDKYFPLKGTCFHCGRDLRHKTLDEIVQRYAFGETVSVLAKDFSVPAQAIELVIAQNSGAPLGQGIALPAAPQARAAAA
jgi:hypothetical protein